VSAQLLLNRVVQFVMLKGDTPPLRTRVELSAFARVEKRESAGLRFYWLTLSILAVWRVTHLLNAEDGPWDIMVRLRRRAGNAFWGALLDCFYCLSLWIAAPLAYWLGDSWRERLLLWPAMSAGAILLQKLSSRYDHHPPAIYFEDPEEENRDVMLRQEERAVHTRGTKSSS
jgi:hypothetical protein